MTTIRQFALRHRLARGSARRRHRAAATGLAILLAGLSAGVNLATATPAAAYSLEGCRWHGYLIDYYIYAPALPYATVITNAGNSWTQTPTKIFMVRVTTNTYNVLVDIYNFGNTGFDGITYYTCSAGYFSGHVETALNTYYTADYSSTGRQQVQAHEFGHSLGLGHNNSNCYTLMYPSSSRYFTCGIYTPQQDDINGINAIYP
jgi:hypothetical protein